MELAANATKHGTPLMRPLRFDFPTEMLAMAEVEDAFMLGPKYLAAPVLEDGARVRTVHLPRTDGGWTHYYSGAKYAGGANVTVPAPLDELPLFVRSGF